jgi:hypothetical protein
MEKELSFGTIVSGPLRLPLALVVGAGIDRVKRRSILFGEAFP